MSEEGLNMGASGNWGCGILLDTYTVLKMLASAVHFLRSGLLSKPGVERSRCGYQVHFCKSESWVGRESDRVGF